jgi:hypothetical protein
MNNKRNKGAICGQADRKGNLNMLKKILNSDKYKNEYINKHILCIILEFILRIFNKNKINGKIWFLKSHESVLINIENISF